MKSPLIYNTSLYSLTPSNCKLTKLGLINTRTKHKLVMAAETVLVLGATGPLGICVIRELLHRNHCTIAYVRSPEKIPEALKSNPLLEVSCLVHSAPGVFPPFPVPSPLDEPHSQPPTDRLTPPPPSSPYQIATGAIESPLLAQTIASKAPTTIISLLGPTPASLANPFGAPLPYPAQYAEHILPAARAHGVRRILALCTLSHVTADDESSWTRAGLRGAVRALMPRAYQAMVGIAGVFEEEAGAGGLLEGVDWLLMRVPGLAGGSDDMGWRVDREIGGVYAGVVGGEWTANVKRGRLAKWCVDWAEGEVTVGEGVGGKGRMPAVSAARG